MNLAARRCWDAMQQALKQAEPDLTRLQDEQSVTVVKFYFAGDLAEFDANAKPVGSGTDFGTALHSLFERHGRDRNLLGIAVMSDGGNNGIRFPALGEAARWRPCPARSARSLWGSQRRPTGNSTLL